MSFNQCSRNENFICKEFLFVFFSYFLKINKANSVAVFLFFCEQTLSYACNQATTTKNFPDSKQKKIHQQMTMIIKFCFYNHGKN